MRGALQGDEARERQVAAQEVQKGRLAALTQQHGLVDGDMVSAIAAHCNERKLAAKTVSVGLSLLCKGTNVAQYCAFTASIGRFCQD